MAIGEETRVTKVTALAGKIQAPGESCLVEIYGPNLGKRYPLQEDEITIGRDAKNFIVVDLDNISRRHAQVVMREMAGCHRYEGSLSLLMFDVDHFKGINDQNGHLAGDFVLRELSALVRQRVRKEECVARYGGEEFAIVLPESGPEKVRRFADK